MEHKPNSEYDQPEIAPELEEVALSAEEEDSLRRLSQRFHVAITEKRTVRGDLSTVGTILGVTAGIIARVVLGFRLFAHEQVGYHNTRVARQAYTGAVAEAEYIGKVDKELSVPARVSDYRPEGFSDFITDLSSQLQREPTLGEAKTAFELQRDGHIVQKDMLIALMKQSKLEGSQPIAMAKALLK